MSVRFILGRAGSGKTHACISAIRRRLQEDPIDGPRLIFLVPEQAGLQMERAIIDPGWAGDSRARNRTGKPEAEVTTVSVAHRAEVLSFQRLARRVLEHVNIPVRTALTEPARVMVLRHLVGRESARLRYYRRVDRAAGFLRRLSSTVAELIQENIAPESLAEAPSDPGFSELPLFASAAKNTGQNPHQQAKLHDLQILYGAYLDYLGAELLDPTQHLQLARAHLARCDWLQGAQLWVDGFASFSEQERLTLLGLAKLAQHADVTLLIDPARQGPNPALATFTAGRLFARIENTWARLRAGLKEMGVEELPAVELKPATLPRFAASAALANLERGMFGRRADGVLPDWGRAAPSSAPIEGAVELVELPSRRVEVNYAVSRIREWVQNSRRPLRYRDIALVVRDLEPYHDLLSDALRSREIPFFIDRRRPIAHHPLVEFVRGIIAVAFEDASLESLRLLLKTDLTPISRQRADELENYLLASGITGWPKWHEEWTRWPGSRRKKKDDAAEPQKFRLARVNQTRGKLVELLDGWMSFARPPAHPTGAEWSRRLLEVLEECRTGEALARWSEDLRNLGNLDAAEEHEQAWTGVLSVLDDVAFALGDAKMSADDLAVVLDAGLTTLTLGLAPPTVDQVLVGSIERSRHPDIKAAIILGFNDGVFPRRENEDSILNDDDRELLQDRGLTVRPGACERNLDESLLIYIALTRPSEKLVLTYAAADELGRALRPSPYLDEVCAALPGVKVRFVGDPVRNRDSWDVLCMSDLRRRLAEEFSSRPDLDRDAEPIRARWNAVYLGARRWLHAQSQGPWGGLDEQDEARISPAGVERLFVQPLHTSVSRLECYAACPFHYFARDVLRLDERLEAVLRPVDIGQVQHAVLEDVARGLVQSDASFEHLSDSMLDAAVRESCRRVAATEASAEWLDARNSYVLRRTAPHLARVLRAHRQRCTGTNSRILGGELRFGLEPQHSLPAIQIDSPLGRRVLLRGRIDRLDVIQHGGEALGVVIDYKKTRDQKLDLCEVYHGLSLQLPVYLMAIGEYGVTPGGRAIKPAAGLYVSLTPCYESVAHPDLAKGDSVGAFRPRGLISSTAILALDPSTSGRSSRYNTMLKKDGAVGDLDKTDLADEASLRRILEHARGKVGELADGVLAGDMRVSPCRVGNYNACRFCEHKAVCRVEPGLNEVRYLDRLRRTEVLKRLG